MVASPSTLATVPEGPDDLFASSAPSDDGRTNDIAPRWIFFERQKEKRCAISAINNAKQGPRFCPESFDEFAAELEKSTGEVQHDREGNYSAMVIQHALKSVDAEFYVVSREELQAFLSNEVGIGAKYVALVFHSISRDHWWAAKDVSGKWYMLDSLAPGPQQISKRIEEEALERISSDVTLLGVVCAKPFGYQGWAASSLQEHQGWFEESEWDRRIFDQIERETEQEIKDQELARKLAAASASDFPVSPKQTPRRRSRKPGSDTSSPMDTQMGSVKRTSDTAELPDGKDVETPLMEVDPVSEVEAPQDVPGATIPPLSVDIFGEGSPIAPAVLKEVKLEDEDVTDTEDYSRELARGYNVDLLRLSLQDRSEKLKEAMMKEQQVYDDRCPVTADDVTKQAWNEMHEEAKQVVIVAKVRLKAIRDAIRYKVDDKNGELPVPYPEPVAISLVQEEHKAVTPLAPL